MLARLALAFLLAMAAPLAPAEAAPAAASAKRSPLEAAAIAQLEAQLKRQPYTRQRLAQIKKWGLRPEGVTMRERYKWVAIAVYEDQPDHDLTFWHFEVDPVRRRILYYDVLSDTYVPLAQALKDGLL